MLEENRIMLTHKELVECLIKDNDIHEGLWAIAISFGLGAGNIAENDSPNVLFPAALVPVTEIGIQRFDEATPLTVDAAQVNPKIAKKPTKKGAK